ncbi:hypothetical protein BH23ACT3_BH23ACT3_17810 [soil metagenome]
MDRTSSSRVPVAADTGPAASADDVVELIIPAKYPNLRLARLAASGIGAQHGADVRQIDEICLVVDEACATLLECALPARQQADRLHIRFEPGESTLSMTVVRAGAELVDRPSAISVALLDSVCVSWKLDGSTVTAVVPAGAISATSGAE